jgi:hypothetical protein
MRRRAKCGLVTIPSIPPFAGVALSIIEPKPPSERITAGVRSQSHADLLVQAEPSRPHSSEEDVETKQVSKYMMGRFTCYGGTAIGGAVCK